MAQRQAESPDRPEPDTVELRIEIDRRDYEFLSVLKREAGLTWTGMLKFSGDRVAEILEESREYDIVAKIEDILRDDYNPAEYDPQYEDDAGFEDDDLIDEHA